MQIESQLQEMETQCEGMVHHMAARCMRLHSALQEIMDHWADSNSTSTCAEEMAEIAERALRVS